MDVKLQLSTDRLFCIGERIDVSVGVSVSEQVSPHHESFDL